jgi:hypothetical protein
LITIYVHLEGLENTLVDVEELPSNADTILVGRHPRRRDGKDVDYMQPNVNTLIVPISRIMFIEVMSDELEEEFETFIRE